MKSIKLELLHKLMQSNLCATTTHWTLYMWLLLTGGGKLRFDFDTKLLFFS
jgi:hypothetical protein